MSEVFTTEETAVKVEVGGEVYCEPSPLTTERLKELAREAGVRKFTVEDGDGRPLTSSDFPVSDGTVRVREYNEAKGR